MSLVETLPTPETATWCESGTVGDGGASPGDIDPSGGDIAHGWPATSTPPPRQRFNWIENIVHRVTRYLRQRGIAEWHAGETYPPNARTQHSGFTWQNISGGNLTTTEPGSDATKWVKWGHSEVDLGALLQTGLQLYSATTVYNPNDRCQDSNGLGWVRIGAGTTTGTAPGSDATKWIMLASANRPSGISTYPSTSVTNINCITLPGLSTYSTGQYTIRILSFMLTDVSNPSGYVDVTLTGDAALDAYAVWTANYSSDYDVSVAKPLGITKVSTNVWRIENGILGVSGPHPALYVMAMGGVP